MTWYITYDSGPELYNMSVSFHLYPEIPSPQSFPMLKNKRGKLLNPVRTLELLSQEETAYGDIEVIKADDPWKPMQCRRYGIQFHIGEDWRPVDVSIPALAEIKISNRKHEIMRKHDVSSDVRTSIHSLAIRTTDDTPEPHDF